MTSHGPHRHGRRVALLGLAAPLAQDRIGRSLVIEKIGGAGGIRAEAA